MPVRPCNLTTYRSVQKQVNGLSYLRCCRLASSVANPGIHDVVIVGGGPAGLALAASLRSSSATSHLKMGLIESQDLKKNAVDQASAAADIYSNRCSSLAPSSVDTLKRMISDFGPMRTRIQPYSRMNVWDGMSDARIAFDWSSAHSLPFVDSSNSSSSSQEARIIAHMTENANLTSGLLSHINSLAGISVFPKTRVESIDLGENTTELDLRSWPILTLSSGDKIAARLLVGADGPNSPVRTFAGIESHGWDYERHGVVATLSVENGNGDSDHQSQTTAYQRFLPTGPAALLPLPGNLASLVWSTTPERAAILKSLSSEDMVAMVNAAFRLSTVDLEYLHKIPSGQADEVSWRERHTPFDVSFVPRRVIGVQSGSVASFPLKMRHADTYTGERVALVGDAAHTIHPLAGQGLNLGLSDVRSLAHCISQAVSEGADIGSTLSLEAYAADRYAKNHAMLGSVDKLHKLYSWEAAPVVAARSLGLKAVDKWGGLKGLFMKLAAG
ncbi:MAG: putative ubiquinone biosynthesis monooxygenase [Alyxoria varia]|nr:MAG: putative ubiquinone biosynthesis monooxygenase [Alyxoria varia]